MLIHDDVPTARGFDGVKVSASEHRAVANGRDERRIEKRFRSGRGKTKRWSMTQQKSPYIGGVITSEGWFLTPKMSSKGPLFVKKNPGAVLGVVVEKNKT